MNAPGAGTPAAPGDAAAVPAGALEPVEDGRAVRLPGFVNAHSHAFHRALRGVSELAGGDFWTWRSLMYEVADRLDPDSYRELATLVYVEMLLAGFTTVGEFHYLHHGPGGTPYADPNEMTFALVEAAASAGIRLTLLDACYLQASAGGEPLEGTQLRYSDGDGDRFSRRVTAALETGRFLNEGREMTGGPGELRPRLGVAIHSVRAVPPRSMTSVAAWAGEESAPLHVHLSEQRKENEDCLAATARTPTDLLASAGALTAHTTAIHSIHLTAYDVARQGLAGCGVCACPTTERDLGDGIGPFASLAEAGATLCIGSDSHAVIDPFEELRGLEYHQRLAEERRGIMSLAGLLEAGTNGGGRALGWSEAERAGDSVTIRLDGSPALAAGGDGPDALLARVLYAASAADVASVTVAGRPVVEDGEHRTFGPRKAIASRLEQAIRRLLA